MSGWLALSVLAAAVLVMVAVGLAVASITGGRRRWPVLAALGLDACAIAGLGFAIPGLANDLRSAIVALLFEDTGVVTVFERLADSGWAVAGRSVWGWIVGLLDWWRGLFDVHAWRSMGFVLVPLAIAVVPLFLWQITKLHIDD